MLAAQFFGTNGVAIALLLAFAMTNFALLDVALLFALLASIATAAFVSHAWGIEEPQTESTETVRTTNDQGKL
jgi:multicomponent Na+:H+ antiporter subunit F